MEQSKGGVSGAPVPIVALSRRAASCGAGTVMAKQARVGKASKWRKGVC